MKLEYKWEWLSYKTFFILDDNWKEIWDLRYKEHMDNKKEIDLFLIQLDEERKWYWTKIINILKEKYNVINFSPMKWVEGFWKKMWGKPDGKNWKI